MKVCLVHDDLVQLGGAERLFEQISKIFPDAPIYTSIVNFEKIPKSIDPKRVRTSFMQKIPFAEKLYKALLPLYPLAFESFNFDEFDLVISSTTRFANSIITKPKTVHICYMNSIPRFLYEENKKNDYLNSAIHFLVSPYMKWLKKWDKAASSRADFYIANSKNVQNKIKKYYGRQSIVIHPFADTEFFKPGNQPAKQSNGGNYHLIVSRLVKWKKIDIAIKACRQLGVSLKVVGQGPDTGRLMSLARKRFRTLQNSGQASRNDKIGLNHGFTPGVKSGRKPAYTPGVSAVEFLGHVNREKLSALYQNAQALIVTQEEDFGIAAVEAQACGIPVIGFIKGGSAEIVIDRKTGVLFDKQTPSSLKDAILASSRLKYEKIAIRKNALRFTKSIFEKKLKQTLENYVRQS